MTRRLVLLLLFASSAFSVARAQTPPLSIVLPPRLLANGPATLAILGADGHLAPGVIVDIGNGQHVTSDATGRAAFTAPPDGAFIAKAQGVSASALVDATSPRAAPPLSVAPDVSQHDRFAVCGSGFSGDASVDHVTINGDASFVLAASPVCVVVLPQARTLAGTAKIEIDTAGARTVGATSLVALDFLSPNPLLQPGHKGKLLVRAEGTDHALRIVVENHSPDVIRFMRGDVEQLRTSGGARNQAPIDVQAIRSGNFSFHARILSPPDPARAVRYLAIAESLVPKTQNNMRRALKAIATHLTHQPRDAAKSRAAVEHLAASTPASSLHTLLDAAADCL
ncbi:MAG TPA: hypothetical protein VJN69_05275 [Candidatus Acidoferrales bacterium]|nr:hypothetical protein [Candidatus Acidoferrales bacterium]